MQIWFCVLRVLFGQRLTPVMKRQRFGSRQISGFKVCKPEACCHQQSRNIAAQLAAARHFVPQRLQAGLPARHRCIRRVSQVAQLVTAAPVSTACSVG